MRRVHDPDRPHDMVSRREHPVHRIGDHEVLLEVDDRHRAAKAGPPHRLVVHPNRRRSRAVSEADTHADIRARDRVGTVPVDRADKITCTLAEWVPIDGRVAGEEAEQLRDRAGVAVAVRRGKL